MISIILFAERLVLFIFVFIFVFISIFNYH